MLAKVTCGVSQHFMCCLPSILFHCNRSVMDDTVIDGIVASSRNAKLHLDIVLRTNKGNDIRGIL